MQNIVSEKLSILSDFKNAFQNCFKYTACSPSQTERDQPQWTFLDQAWCDGYIRPALQESVKVEWAGDCNLPDGTLENLRAEYESRRELIKAGNPDVQVMQKHLQEDIDFLKGMLADAVKSYEDKVNQLQTNSSSSKAKLKKFPWEKVELAALLQQAVELRDMYSNLTPDSQTAAQVHHGLEEDLYTYCKHLYKKKRWPAASHMLVIMLSDEKRATKPYALPVQYIPYHSITDKQVCGLTSKITDKMRDGYDYVGMCYIFL